MKAVLRVHTVEREKKKPFKKQLEKDEYLLSFQSEAKKNLQEELDENIILSHAFYSFSKGL